MLAPAIFRPQPNPGALGWTGIIIGSLAALGLVGAGVVLWRMHKM